MPRNYTIPAVIVCLVVALSLCGCGAGHPPLASVTGVVTYKGQPLADAKVVFVPEEGQVSTGTTDANGKYELKYFDGTPGAELGKHSVKVITRKVDEFDIETAKERLPAKYHSKTTLKAQVVSGGEPIDFTLE